MLLCIGAFHVADIHQLLQKGETFHLFSVTAVKENLTVQAIMICFSSAL